MGDLNPLIQEQTLKYVKDPACLAGPIDDHPPRPDAEHKRTPDKPSMPCGHRMNGRNLVVCIDGTSNQFGEQNTNVIELYNLILKEVDDNQRTWYNSGIGTYARPSWKSLGFYKKVIYHKIDLAIAWDFERTVLGAYRWLSDNYEQGDCIFLFGFSRGAFQVRVLSAMIDKVGLVYKGNEMQIPFAYELYADPESDKPTVAKVGSFANHSTSMADRFKKTFSHKDVKVHFVGAWDTVSSIGVVRGKCMLPRTVDGMKHVCFFRHALALDERRVKFLPEYAYGGSAQPAKSGEKNEGLSALDKASPSSSPSTEGESAANDPEVGTGSEGILPHTKEVWFAGTHSDIGGGNVQNVAMDRTRPPLRWMVFEAGAAGLRTAPFERELFSEEQIDIVESLTWPWLFFEICPFKRLTFTRKEHGLRQTTRKPHLGSGRKIHRGQKIHSSLLRADDETSEKYTPKARPVDDDNSFWEKLRGKEINANASEWLELDLYEHSRNVVESLITGGDDTALQSLHHTAISGDARHAVYEKVIEALGRKGLTSEVKHRLLNFSMDVLKTSSQDGPDFKLSPSTQIRPLLSDLLNGGNEEHEKTAQDFVALFTATDSRSVFHLPNSVSSVVVSSDGKHVVSTSDVGQTVQIWNAETGKPVGDPLQGHRYCVRSAALSPDTRCIVAGSGDGMVGIWDAETGKPVGVPVRGHKNCVRSLAFSPDGRRVASGSDDGTVRIWDAESGKPKGEPLQGHSNWVRSVAFSPDGKRVGSGSDDGTVRIWDVESGNPLGEPLQGHSNWVRSVAFSPDGRRVASGSDDGAVRVWDVETGKPVGEPLRGHSSWIISVAFSPDGAYVVSGLDGGTVRIWDAETGKPVGVPLRGHTNWVISVGFSPDGTRIISGSDDRTVRVWDLEAFEIQDTARTGQTADKGEMQQS